MKKLVFISVAGMFVLHPLSVQAQTQQMFTLRLSATDIEKIGKGLSELPYKDVLELMNNLRSQVIQQQSQPTVAPEPKNEPSKP